MPAENMSGFMRQNAADLVGVICFQQRPRMDEQIVAVTDKGIQAVVIDNINFIAVKRNTGSLKNRTDNFGQILFGLFIGNDAHLSQGIS